MSRKRISNRTRKGIQPMTPRAIERAAMADPDARPLTAADLKRIRRTPQIKVTRRALGV
jgi:putative transcriptional regulator